MKYIKYYFNNEPVMKYTAESAPEVGKEIQLRGTSYRIKDVDDSGHVVTVTLELV